MHPVPSVSARPSRLPANVLAARHAGFAPPSAQVRRGLGSAGRAATCLGIASLATRAAAELDLVQVHGLGRLRLDGGTLDRLGAWRPSPDSITPAEATAYAAVFGDPPCLAAYVADEGHSWPDVANFSLTYATAGLQLATSQIEPEVLSCAVGRIQAAARNDPAVFRPTKKQQDEGAAVLWFSLGFVFCALTYAGTGPLRQSASDASSEQAIALSRGVRTPAITSPHSSRPDDDVAPPPYASPEEQSLLEGASAHEVADMV